MTSTRLELGARSWIGLIDAEEELEVPGCTMTTSGDTWVGGAASFLGMWIVMMVPMMLPSLVPMLWRYRESIGAIGTTRGAVLTAIVSAGYFLVWSAAGLGAYPASVLLTRATPIAAGTIVLIAGTIQFTGWKSRHLDCCRQAPGRGRALPADPVTAWRHGLRLGVHCFYSCLGLTTMLLIIGMMDVRAMAVVAAAITVERLAPAGERVAQAIGVVVVGAGVLLIARAGGLG
jgi:predicted metal-binding membrane protein